MKKYIIILVLVLTTICFADIFKTHLWPATDNAYDLGTSIYEWRNLYIDGTANIDTITDGTMTIRSGEITSATGLISMWTNDSLYMTSEDLSGITPISYSSTTGVLSLDTPLKVQYGGTSAATLTDGGILLGSGTSAITALGVATNGQIPIGDGTTDPVLATITGSSGITVTNAAASITLDVNDLGVDHGGLTGLGDDDHSHYFADTTIGARTTDFNTTGTIFAEQLTSTDDITMLGHLLTLGNDTANDIVMSFRGSDNDGNIVFDESANKFNISTGLVVSGLGSSTFAGSILPAVDDSKDLGSTTKEWNDIWIDGTANIDVLNVVDVSSELRPNSTAAYDLGRTSLRWRHLFLSGNADVAGSITGGSLVTGGDIGISGDTNLLQLAANALTVNGTVTATGAGNFAGLTLNLTQDYVFGDRGSGLTISSQTSGNPMDIETFAADGNGTDDVFLHFYGYGTAGAVSDSHRMRCGWDASDANYIIHILPSGDQTVKPLTIYTEGNPGQLVLLADGNNTMSGDLGVTGNVTGSNLDIAGWDAHIIDSSQAHSDYLINNGNDSTSGVLTVESLIVSDANYIGSVSDTDAIQIEADGDVVLTQDLTVGNGLANSLIEYGGASPGIANNLEVKAKAGSVYSQVKFSSAEHANTLGFILTTASTAFSTPNALTFTSSDETVAFTAATAGKSITLTSPTIALVGAATIGDGGTTNYAGISATGDITATGSARITANNSGGLIIPSGTTPAPNVVGAIFLDTDESANGSLMMYGNGAWRKIMDLP